jgi:YfiH family protein
LSFEYAEWPLPANVRVGWSTRVSGYSSAPFQNHNVAKHVSDIDELVFANRELLRTRLTGTPTICWLNQTHSSTVVSVEEANASEGQDGCYTQQAHIACSVMTADCLPVFMWSVDGHQIAAVHAGWRGLADGILLNALSKFDHPSRVVCGIGPAISKSFFEVGDDVVSAFSGFSDAEHHFQSTGSVGKYWCDLPKLAEAQLRAVNVRTVYQSDLCTFENSDRFYSYRREGLTGRMANLIWKNSL